MECSENGNSFGFAPNCLTFVASGRTACHGVRHKRMRGSHDRQFPTVVYIRYVRFAITMSQSVPDIRHNCAGLR